MAKVIQVPKVPKVTKVTKVAEVEKLSNKEFGLRLERRTKDFAIAIIRLAGGIAETSENKIFKYQLVKSATSVGANYREANRAVSRADFAHKISICEKEASETKYWLELLLELPVLPVSKIEPIFKECSELVALFTTIRNHTRKQKAGI